MFNENKERGDVVTEYYDQDILDNERAGNHRDTNEMKTMRLPLRELLEAQANYHAGTQSALTICLQKFRFKFYLESPLVQISPIDGEVQRYTRSTLRQRLLYLFHHSLLEGYPGER